MHPENFIIKRNDCFCVSDCVRSYEYADPNLIGVVEIDDYYRIRGIPVKLLERISTNYIQVEFYSNERFILDLKLISSIDCVSKNVFYRMRQDFFKKRKKENDQINKV